MSKNETQTNQYVVGKGLKYVKTGGPMERWPIVPNEHQKISNQKLQLLNKISFLCQLELCHVWESEYRGQDNPENKWSISQNEEIISTQNQNALQKDTGLCCDKVLRGLPQRSLDGHRTMCPETAPAGGTALQEGGLIN